jgi:RNA polymerase sigma factor (sigma-70 family)
MVGRVPHREVAGAPTLTELTTAALRGDERAWRSLVERLQRVVWKTVNMCTTDADIRNDAFAASWLRLAERLDTIREPEKLPGWLATTAANEVRTLMRQRLRSRPQADFTSLDDVFLGIVGGASWSHHDFDRQLIRAEAARAVRTAFAELDEECRLILAVLVIQDDTSYRDASDQLQRPIGSLGPTRRRCLDKLRELPALRELMADHGHVW